MENHALVFIKPHAHNEEAIQFVKTFITDHNISIVSGGRLSTDDIVQNDIIDRHYSSIAYAAAQKTPAELTLSNEAKQNFSAAFHTNWDELLQSNMLVNCVEAADRLKNASGSALNELWKSSQQAKIAPGIYAAHFQQSGLYVINGFYLAMKELYTIPGSMVTWYSVSFNPSSLSWKDFRRSVIGATDPKKAAHGSLRNIFQNTWEKLHLAYPPNMTENGVHASAGPVEALKERIIWTGSSIDRDPFGKILLAKGFQHKQIEEMLEDPDIMINGEVTPLFDLTEEMDSADAITLLHKI